MSRILVWYSDGAASAVAAKLATEQYGDACEILKCDTTVSEHPDNVRFRRDVETWIGRSVTLIASDRYRDIDDVFERRRYMSGVAGAICTTELKKMVRHAYERADDVHVFGYTADEPQRIHAFAAQNPELRCVWILRDAHLSKARCLDLIAAAGIRLPAMYALGFTHNNCLGCVKATSPAYWQRVRRHFPDVFARRARQSRDIGARLVRVDNQRIFLDELPSDGRYAGDDGDIDCGPFCQLPLDF